ncbi:MAG: flavodoxin [Clostridiales bacterium]|nr:flavodoxin [Clostridiales bacterium]
MTVSDSLIAFYSRAAENYRNGELKILDIGNTEAAAGILKNLTGAELFKIEQRQPYSTSYNECIAEAQSDQQRNARPALKAYPESIEPYRLIYLGFPNYWGTMPMAVFTFLEHFDFSGKTIRPFCTHEGSGMGNSEEDIRRLCPGATVEQGLSLHGSSVWRAGKEVERWIKTGNPGK